MRYSLAPVALAALAAATPVPQGVTESISPDGETPEGCLTSYDGEFNIQIVNVTDALEKRSIHKRQSQILGLTLADGILTDTEDRTGYIAANSQFQFDAPPQTGAEFTAGWSVCDDRLTLGSDDVFYSCLSGDFYNLYKENQLNADQCVEVYIDVVGMGAGSAASVMPDGQPTGSAVSQIPDGQVTGAPISQIPDGQIQATSAVAPVSQIPDGQIQATSAVAPVSQIPDGQIQATPVSQIPDGQIQAPTVVSQIPDGQIQAPTVTPVSQIPDGQIQAPSGTGYMPSANGTMVYPSAPIQQTGAAVPMEISSGLGLMAAIFGVVML